MGQVTRQVWWSDGAQNALQQVYDYIQKNTLQHAEEVIADILNAVERAANNPEIYRPDKYKKENTGSYRAFELHHYRVSFHFNDKIIRVLQVRHTSMLSRIY